MKVYNRKDFLQLPTGTFFCKGEKWFWENMSIKGETWENDFLYVDVCNIDSNNPEEWADRLEDSLANGTPYPINNSTSRDGYFEEDSVFLVFEKEDLEFLITCMMNSLRKVNVR